MLGRLFKPRWQHHDPLVRARAVDHLDPRDRDDATTLATLARGDAEAMVRAAAAKRLTDIRLLGEMVEKDAAAEVRESATHQVERLLAGLVADGPGLENRVRLIQLTDNLRALAFIATESPDPACRQAAVERMDDPDRLLELALHGADEPLRAAAAQRLDSAEHLRRLVREGRDKRALRAARDKLKALQTEQARMEQQREELAQLERQLTRHAGQTPDKLYGPRLQQLEQHWQALRADADETTRQRIEALLEDCHHNIEVRERERDESLRREQADTEHRATLDTLERLLGEITPETWDQGTGSLRALLDTQERRWQVASDVLAPEPELAERFRTLHERLKNLLDTAGRVLAEEERLTALLERSRAETLSGEERDNLFAELPEWPADVAAPAVLGELLTRLAPGETPPESAPAPVARQRNEDAHRVLGALRRELNKRNLRHANRLWHKAEALLDEHPDPTATARMKKLRPELDELQDWHAFAAEPKKADLCARMETLADTDMDPQEKATAIQALHEEWRDLMSSDQDRDQNLWDRFKAASDRAYEPCREHFRELDRDKAENLARREALCRQLEEYLAAQDWERADWPAVWEIRQKAPAEWKGYQPVRFTDAREVQRRFSALLTQLDERLNQATETHRAERERLLERLEALAEQEDREDAARQARELQTQWRQAGWVHPNVHRGMQRRFRKLNDRIFEARDARRDERRAAADEERRAVETLLGELEPALSASPAELDLAALQEKMDRLAELGCPPSAKQTLRRVEEARDRFRALRRDLPRWRQWQSLRDRVDTATGEPADPNQRQLAVALEVLAGVESPEDAREERMAWQLKKLPKAMTSGGGGDALEEVTRLLEEAKFEGLDEDIRRRIMAALEALEPRV